MIKPIEAKQVSFRYGAEAVLENISFSAAEGDFAAIIGDNGAGKSTLLKLILGEINPDTGHIFCFGENMRGFSGWGKIGYVPQHNILSANRFPATAQEVVQANLYKQIGLFKFPAKRHREKALSALTLVGMNSFAGHLIGELSGGQQQRVMLARALAADPTLLILDEPTSGIDSQSKRSIYNFLSHINKNYGATIIMVTHDISEVSDIVNRMLALKGGSLIELKHQKEGMWQ